MSRLIWNSEQRYIARRTILQTTIGASLGATLGFGKATAQNSSCDETPRYENFEDGLDNWEQGGDVSLTNDGVVTDTSARITDSEDGEGSTGEIDWECAGEFSTHEEFELRGVYQAVTDTSYNYRFGIRGDDRYLLKIDTSSDAIGFGNTTFTSVSGETIDSAFVGTWVEFRMYFDGNGTAKAKVWEYNQSEPGEWQISTEFDQDTGTIRAGAGQNQHGRELLVDELEIIENPSDNRTDNDGDQEEEEDDDDQNEEEEREDDEEQDEEEQEEEDEEDVQPIAEFSLTPDPPEADQQVAFDADDSSVETGEIVSYSWDFGDGATASGETATHTFEEDGGYVVELTVVSDEGTTGTTTETVGVEEGDTDENDDTGGDDGTTVEVPGFGIGSAVASLGGAGYVFKRRLNSEDD